MRTSLAERLAAVYSAVKYAAEKEMSQLDALVAEAKAGEERGDALPRKVLADYLEENPQHLHDDETLTHLRSESGQHRHGVNIHHDRDTNRVVASPHLPEPHNFSDWTTGDVDWTDYAPHEQQHWTESLAAADAAEDRAAELLPARWERRELLANAGARADGRPDDYANEVHRLLDAHFDREEAHDTAGEPTETESGRYTIHRVGGRYYFAPSDSEWNTHNEPTDFSRAFPTAEAAHDAASLWEQQNDDE